MALYFSAHELSWLEIFGYTYVRCFSRSRRSIVGLFQIDQGGYRVIKHAPVGLEYEYDIGCKLYQRSLELEPNLRIVGQTFDLLQRNKRKYLVLEYLRGKTLVRVIGDRLAYKVKDRVLLTKRYVEMLRILYRFQTETGFTHYDLHYNNIITNDDLQSFKIIDFGRSHYPGVTGFIEIDIGSIFIGKIPSVTDRWIDLVRLVLLMLATQANERWRHCTTDDNSNPVSESLSKVLLANGFSDWIRGPRPSWVSHHEYKGCSGAAIMKGGEVALTKCESLYDASYGGFWVNDRLSPSDVTQSKKIDFGLTMAQIKQASIDQRPNPDPVILLDLFQKEMLLTLSNKKS